MTLFEHLHPATVHFPIALLLVGSVAALAYPFRPFGLDLRMFAWLLLGLGWFGALVAILTGLVAQSGLPPEAPYRDVLNWHIGGGVAQLILYGLLLYMGWIYRSARARKRRAAAGRTGDDLLDDPSARWWVTLLLVAGALSVLATGWNGGILVYEWGVGVN
jgi:uncharacterized membrane protein